MYTEFISKLTYAHVHLLCTYSVVSDCSSKCLRCNDFFQVWWSHFL